MVAGGDPLQMKTYVATPANRQRDWYVVDADGQTLGSRRDADRGRACVASASPSTRPTCDTGDFVVVVNAEKIRVTGNKLNDKIYYRHSGYPGGLRSRTLAGDARAPARGGHPQGGLKGDAPPGTAWAGQQLTKLKVYAGPEHPHEAQKPKQMEVQS